MSDNGNPIVELRAMPEQVRQAILRSLTRAERSEALRRLEVANAAAGTVDGYSPWLAEMIELAGAPDAASGATGLTAATRHILVRGTLTPRSTAKPNGRSLFDAVGGFTTRRKPA